MSLCFLFLIWTVSRNFSTPKHSRLLLRLFVIFLGRISHLRFFVFSCFLFFKNRSFFAPQGNWAPGVGSKVERSTEAGSNRRMSLGLDGKFCPFVFCCHFERSVSWIFSSVFLLKEACPYSLRSSWFFLDHGSLLRKIYALPTSMFPCFQFCEKWEFWPDTRDFCVLPLKIGIKYLKALPTELAGLEQTHVTLFSVSNLKCILRNFSTPMLLLLEQTSWFFWVALVWSEIFRVFLVFLFFKNRSFFTPQGNWAPERWIKSRTLYWIGYLDSKKESFVFLFFAPGCHLVILNVRPNFFECFAFPLSAHPLWKVFLDHGRKEATLNFRCFLAFGVLHFRR